MARDRRRGFVGRERERARIAEWLAEPTSAFLTVLGPPGIGKTRLVREATRELELETAWARWPEGATDAPNALAGALDVQRADARALHEALRPVSCLVIDGAELASESSRRALAALLAELVDALPELRCVVTARAALRGDETLLVVPPLSTPTGPADLLASEAYAYFVACRARLGLEGPPPDATHEALAVVLGRVGALPLAIELVAPALSELGTATLLAERAQPLAWERDHALARALDTSARALPDDARTLLGELAVLGGPFDADDVTALAGDDAPRLLSLLRTSSWIAPREDLGSYELLPPVRDFVLDAVRPREAPLGSGLARVLVARAARGKAVPRARLLAAIAHGGLDAATRRETLSASIGAFAGVEGLDALSGALAELERRRLVTAVDVARIRARALLPLGRFDELDEALRIAESADASARSEARTLRARMAFHQGDYELAAALAEDAIAARPDDVEVLALAATIRGQPSLGLALHDRALAQSPTGPHRPILRALRARFLAENGDPGEALAELGRAEAERGARGGARVDDSRLEASLRTTRGLALHDLGELRASYAAYDDAIERYARAASPLAAYVRCARLLATLEAGDALQARALLRDVLDAASPELHQLRPFVSLGRFLLEATPPDAPALDGSTVSISLALVSCYAARCGGELLDAEHTVLAANARPAGWSVISRSLGRLVTRGPYHAPERAPELVLTLDERATWFALSRGPLVSLRTRPVLGRVLAQLAKTSLATGARADMDAIASAAWPGERILERARKTRVQVAISTLRKLGLGPHLSHAPTGYRLDVPLRIVPS